MCLIESKVNARHSIDGGYVPPLSAPCGASAKAEAHRSGRSAFSASTGITFPTLHAVILSLIVTDGADRGKRADDAGRDQRNARRTPTTADERWSEVVGISHEGLAVLDAERRFEFASQRTAAALGSTSDGLVGLELIEVLPELAVGDLAAIESSIASGAPARMMCTRRGADGWIRALRLTIVPRRDEHGSPSGLIMLSQDITGLRAFQDQRRRAQHGLIVVEDEEHERITREIHDGPIQVLAALALRLGMTTAQGPIEADDLRQLERAVDSASRELHEILSAPAHSHDDHPLKDWAALLVGRSGLEIEVEDRTTRSPNRATTEALFVFLHETIKGSAALPFTIDAVLTERPDGYELALSVRSRAADQFDDSNVRALASRARQYAALLGGSFEQRTTDAGDRTLTAYLPSLDEQGWWAEEHVIASATSVETGPFSGDTEVSVQRAALSDADREATARASYQGLMELDAELRVRSVNESYALAFARPADELVGEPFEELFHPDDYERLRPHVQQVVDGRAVRFEWSRRNAVGEPRWTQVAASPRLDRSGRFDGALLMTLDTTELHLAEDLRDAVLTDLDRTRRAARRRTARQLDDPIQRLETVGARLSSMIEQSEPGDVLRAIQRELERSIASLRAAVGRLADPDLSDDTWGAVLQTALADELYEGDAVLIVEDRTESGSPQGKAEVFVKIAREAVTNAIRHGRARQITVRLDETAAAYSLLIEDDGVGVDPDSARRKRGNLGIRSMAERAREQGGTFSLEPRPGGGAIVAVSIPRADVTIIAT